MSALLPIGYFELAVRNSARSPYRMEANNLRELYISELQDLYDAENQLIEALPKMAEASNSPELRAGFEEHLTQTRGHAQRLESIFAGLGEDPKRKKCKAMKGL